MKPSVGRIVRYLHSSVDDYRNGSTESAALVTAVHGSGETPLLNLIVFFDAQAPEPRTSVCHEDHRSAALVNGKRQVSGAWKWPERDDLPKRATEPFGVQPEPKPIPPAGE